MSEVAERFHKVGPPFFQRYLPFWLAVWMDRLVVLLVPLLAILIPVVKLLPDVYDWRVRRPLWKWYDALRKLEGAMADQPEAAEKHQQEMQRIDDGIATLPLPVKYSEAHHNLRSYAEYVRRRLADYSDDSAVSGA
jgi:hypothetical protein